MAAVTAAISAGVALAGMGMSIAKAVKANKQEKEAAAAADAAAKQIAKIKEQNAFENVGVPTLGFDLAQQGLDRSTAAALGAAQGAGAEGVLGAAGNIMAVRNEQELQLAAGLQEQEMQRDLYKASAQSDINQRQADREETLNTLKLTGAQSAKAVAEARKAAAISEAIGSAGTALGYGAEAIDLYNGKGGGSGVSTTSDATKAGVTSTQLGYIDELGKYLSK